MKKTNFKSVVEEISRLHESKDACYGNAFGKSFAMYESLQEHAGLQYAVGRMGDKMQRVQNMSFGANVGKASFESTEDTLLDLAAYAIMTVVELRNRQCR